MSFLPVLLLLSSTTALPSPRASVTLQISSLDGPVTTEEVQTFSDYVGAITPADDNIGNKWAYGDSGTALRACGTMYQITGDKSILDQMIRFCDKSLSVRNDLAPAPVGQHQIWTGDIAPVWPNANGTDPLSTGGEQGDPVGGLAFCSSLILKTDGCHNETVSGGDPYGYGETYLERAKTYIKQADYTMTDHVLPRLLNLTDQNRMYFANDGLYKPGEPVPWNQAVMFTYALQYLVDVHDMLQDNADLQQTYADVMQANIDWFFYGDGARHLTSPEGRPVYEWDYAYGQNIEDATHAKMDIQGYYIAYNDARWNVNAEQMAPFACLLVDVLTLPNGTYAGLVDGTCGPATDSHRKCYTGLKQGYLYLPEFVPDQYYAIMAGAGVAPGSTTIGLDAYSQFLWVKNLRYTGTAGNDARWRAWK